jgi:RNA polymerase II subunit A small phosphatase-like protein
MDLMDPNRYCTKRLFREHCQFVNGVFVKDMSQLGRNMKDAVIIDNSPTSYMLQPECGIPIVSWYDDMSDRALYDYIPFLIELSKVNDMREAVTSAVHNNALEVNYAINVCLGIQENEKIAKRQKEIEIARVRKAQ